MRQLLLPMILAALVFPASVATANCTEYGAGVDLEEATTATALLADPEAWKGKTVRVEGEVREVCPMAGCWVTLIPEGGAGEDLRVKVEDGEIVFPLSARGHRATAQGTVEVLEMTREQYVAYQEHLSAEVGETFDPATIGDGPYRRVQVKAVGAEVCD
jgi:hypothetical protein